MLEFVLTVLVSAICGAGAWYFVSQSRLIQEAKSEIVDFYEEALEEVKDALNEVEEISQDAFEKLMDLLEEISPSDEEDDPDSED